MADILNKKIGDWYRKTYEDDDLGDSINREATFRDLFDALDYHQDVYNLIQVGDSLIRERLFSELARLTGMSYETIYQQWLR